MSAPTLPDYLREGLDVLSIGLNPSVRSVEAGYCFANPQNRFWKAFNAAGIVPVALTPSREAMEELLRVYGIGFTDVVKRATPNASALRAADFKAGAPVLRRKLLRYAPAIAWFHGMLAWKSYLRYAGDGVQECGWGEQPARIGQSIVFVTPNPSPANAAFSLEDLTGWYRSLAALSRSLR